MSKINYTFLLWFLPVLIIAQDHTEMQQVTLDKRPAYDAHEYFIPVPIVPVTDHYRLVIPGKEAQELILKIPEVEAKVQKGMMETVFYGGSDSNTVLILACDYTSETPRFYIDRNQNHDFTDDGPFLEKGADGSFWVEIENPNYTGARLVTKMEAITIQNEQVRNNWKKNIKRKPKFAQATVAAPDFWFRTLRYNIRSTDVEVAGIKFQLGLMDTNLNGLFNDPEDRLLVGDFGADHMSTDLNDNNYLIQDNSPFAVGNKGFKIDSIDMTGKSIWFSPIDFSQVPSRLKIGDPLPAVAVQTLDNATMNLNDYIEKGKYNYLEFWGTWCKGCIEELPSIKKAMEAYADQLHIVGLHYGNIKPEKLKGFMAKHGMNWQQLVATQEAVETFKVSGYPYGILIDPEGKIEAFDLRISEVIDRVK